MNSTDFLVVVADDDKASADSMARLMRAAGFAPLVAYGGRAALTLLSDVRPPIAILDLDMPDVSGFEVARRARESGVNTKMVAITGFDRPEDRERALEAGFHAFFTKMSDRKELIAVLRAAIG